jgi:ketosteroid isomerase-like protein
MYALVWRDHDLEAALAGHGPGARHDARRGRVSGVPVEMRFAQVWTFRDGEPARMVLYPDAEKGRRAAGAS